MRLATQLAALLLAAAANAKLVKYTLTVKVSSRYAIYYDSNKPYRSQTERYLQMAHLAVHG
ncbi:hypothetical protein FRC12_006278 [Ceratobasidium sp. 428]|nr:hypothetical protein FRC12_006278 [Ceratobasidium sp. 428]